jgi:hypothetical protein
VVEGRGQDNGQLRIHLRYLEFPDGRHLDLLADPVRPPRRRGQRATVRK